MAILTVDLATKLRRVVKDREMTFRNWSGSDTWIFAIYIDGASYLGCVEIVETTRTMRLHASGVNMLARREREHLEQLCVTFNRL